MKLFIFKSLEQLLQVCFITTSFIIVSLWMVIGIIQDWTALNIVLTSTGVAAVFFLLFSYIYSRTIIAFKRASMHLDAVRNNDYCQYSKPAFTKGKVIEFHQDLKNLSSHLQLLKSRYDQHIFLVYRLIEQLDSPIMVFDERPQLTYANTAFNELFPQPWQIFRNSSPGLLGLEYVDNNWRFKEKPCDNKWQIRHSEFIDQGKTHHLMVFVNIESALRQSQLSAWQQLIRVLGHEIRNSLTPVSALAQGLSLKAEGEREKKALDVITERCQHLEEFVSRYASITKPFHLNCQMISVTNIAQRIQRLLKDIDFEIEIKTENFWADPAFIEQVLLNVIKNADEASEPGEKIKLVFREKGNTSLIEVVDNGHGFANLDNLFVPLYSTKQNGQGIGLSFCRNIIEHHKGTIELINNTNASGVTVSISLPLPSITS
ncbi:MULTISPECIES: PAS domain-containing sensor histidine kinase [unclassified Colwellia]|uniref:sensor histidine kinase n=2 Tax=Colwellia TaxID=28228 RepID=UPI0015F6AC9A|nr:MULTISPECIES: PAS domain-containing sensor histidine kinase [unclassified Colwellia]MBA6350438.1 HAMP domain-containing histidine kinase [Colwellia sp. BRX9-1]MBA6355461.1 HAMP domain-containing histidine kinase [Colwellia sp. BRX8-3]MBA6367218.1 HAMP domain-containing histidine kinase [Colwellia sp. BRX8-5]MBA6377407.1 HAMP domain-containing histidine kinase [Colwellia sp. BRX8-2]